MTRWSSIDILSNIMDRRNSAVIYALNVLRYTQLAIVHGLRTCHLQSVMVGITSVCLQF